MRWSFLTLSGISLAAVLFISAASADTFNFDFSNSGFSGSGAFTESDTTGTPGQFLIDSVTGTTNGAAIQGVLAPGIYPPTLTGDFPNDNLLINPLLAGRALDRNGFSYSRTNGTDINITYSRDRYYLVTDSNFDIFPLDWFSITGTTTSVPFATGPDPIPEPGSVLLLATGALGIAGVVRRRFADRLR